MADEQDNWWQAAPEAPTGKDFLGTLDASRAVQVKALAEGRMTLPNGMALRSPVGQQLLADVAQYDPSFDVANAPARTAARKAFTSGAQGRNITSFNTAIGHLGTLAARSEDLANSSIPLWNSIANTAETATGDPRVTNFNVAKQAVVDELERAFKGTGGNVHEIKQWEETLNSSRSPAQLRGAVSQAADLLNSRIGAMRDSYNAAMGTTEEPLPMLNQHASDALSQFQSPDYLSKGYGAINGHPGMPAAPTNGDGSGPTPPTVGGGSTGAPPSSPTPSAPEAQKPVLSDDGSSDFVSSRDKQFNAEANALLQSGRSSRADFEALAGKYGFQQLPFDTASLDNAIAYTNKGGKGATVELPVQHTGPTIAGKIANSALGSAAVGLADSGSFGLAPKAIGALQAVQDKFNGDRRSFGEVYANDLADAHAAIDASEAAHPLAALGGQVGGFFTSGGVLGRAIRAVPGAGAALARVPNAIAPLANDALEGAAYGAGSQDSLSGVPGGALRGGLLAGAGGALGRGVARGAAAVLSPVANGAVRRLTDAGVTLTPGQILGAGGGYVGRAVKGVEDRVAGFPVIGDVINNTRRGGVEDFNRAAINDALAPIGGTASGIGHEGIAAARQQVAEAYDRALAPLTAVPDAQFTADLRAVAGRSSTLSQAGRDQLASIMDNEVQPYLAGRTQLSGSNIQDIKRGLDGRIANLRGQGASPQDRDLADSLDGVREAVLNLAGRSSPAAAADFRAANRAYSLLSRIEAAGAKSKDGVFSPNQFRQAVTKRGYGTTTSNVAAGSAPMQQLATDASTVLPSSVPDSGTAGRLALGAVLGGGEGYREGGSAGALTGALVGSALLSRPGARAIQYGLAGSRGARLNTLGDFLRRNAALGGAVGAPALLTHRGN